MRNNYEIIASGSTGNAIILRDYILLDCGVPYSKIKDRVRELKLVFISHIHQDHLLPATIKKLAFERPNLKFVVGKFLVDTLVKLGVEKRNIFVLEQNKRYDLGAIEVEPILLAHDVPNFGFKIRFKKDNYKVLYCVDTSTLDGIKARNYNLYLCESNYSKEELEQRKIEKQQNGEFTYEDRVVNTHLSQEQWNKFMLENAGENSECIKIHQHKEKGDIKNNE